jgi:general secretion pathway protein G
MYKARETGLFSYLLEIEQAVKGQYGANSSLRKEEVREEDNLGHAMQARLANTAPFTTTNAPITERVLVVAILCVLCALGSAKFNECRLHRLQTRAAYEIAELELLIKIYRKNIGTYPATLADVGRGDELDPWGHPYVYVGLTTTSGHGAPRKNHKINPINSDFDLYSMGRDGMSKPELTATESLDDIVRIRDGAYIGPAADVAL